VRRRLGHWIPLGPSFTWLNPANAHLEVLVGIGLALMGISVPGRRLSRFATPVLFVSGAGLVVWAIFRDHIFAEVALGAVVAAWYFHERSDHSWQPEPGTSLSSDENRTEISDEDRGRRTATRDLLGRIHQTGRRLRTDTFANEEFVKGWRENLLRVVEEAYGHGRLAMLVQELPDEDGLEWQQRAAWIDEHLGPLASLIAEEQQLDLRPDFDPEAWLDF
jgi:hypothetical protein